MSRVWESLYSKNGLAAKEIAKQLISIEEGERIPRIQDFEKDFQFGRGTIQGALKILESLRAVRLESRGHLGTFLVAKDLDLLKEIAGIGSIMGAMPLPYSSLYEGLATGILEASENMLSRIDLAYMRGSKQRLHGLKARRYDFIVLSQLAAEEEIKEDDSLQIAVNFGPRTYVTAHQIFFADPSNDRMKDGMRVGIDFTSIDQSRLTALECENLDVQLVPINYMQVFEMLQKGSLDAAVWNVDDTRTNKAFKKADFRSEKAKKLSEKATSAVILIEKDRSEVLEYLSNLDVQKIKRIQQKVVKKEIIPHY